MVTKIVSEVTMVEVVSVLTMMGSPVMVKSASHVWVSPRPPPKVTIST